MLSVVVSFLLLAAITANKYEYIYVVWWSADLQLHLYAVRLPSARQQPSMVIVWRLRGNIIRNALCWIVWHNVHGQQHTYLSTSYRSNRLGLSHWDPYTVCRGSCLELCYCNMVEWFWWDSSRVQIPRYIPRKPGGFFWGYTRLKNGKKPS